MRHGEPRLDVLAIGVHELQVDAADVQLIDVHLEAACGEGTRRRLVRRRLCRAKHLMLLVPGVDRIARLQFAQI